MKKILLVCFLFVCSFGASAKEAAWLWKSKTIDCTVTITYGGGPIPFAYQESYAGEKTVCVDGWSLCLSWFCMRAD